MSTEDKATADKEMGDVLVSPEAVELSEHAGIAADANDDEQGKAGDAQEAGEQDNNVEGQEAENDEGVEKEGKVDSKKDVKSVIMEALLHCLSDSTLNKDVLLRTVILTDPDAGSRRTTIFLFLIQADFECQAFR